MTGCRCCDFEPRLWARQSLFTSSDTGPTGRWFCVQVRVRCRGVYFDGFEAFGAVLWRVIVVAGGMFSVMLCGRVRGFVCVPAVPPEFYNPPVRATPCYCCQGLVRVPWRPI